MNKPIGVWLVLFYSVWKIVQRTQTLMSDYHTAAAITAHVPLAMKFQWYKVQIFVIILLVIAAISLFYLRKFSIVFYGIYLAYDLHLTISAINMGINQGMAHREIIVLSLTLIPAILMLGYVLWLNHKRHLR